MTKEEEILGLLTGRLYEERWKSVDDGKMSIAAQQFEIGKTLSISKKDVHDYVKKNGLPAGRYRYLEKPGTHDGHYFVRLDNGKYEVYGQERGSRYYEELYDTYEDALKGIVDGITRYYFEKP